jgi:hypothetical protein
LVTLKVFGEAFYKKLRKRNKEKQNIKKEK